MIDEDKISAFIGTFFAYFHNMYDTYRMLMTQIRSSVKLISRLTDRRARIEKANLSNTPFTDKDIKKKLLFIVINGINDNVEYIQDYHDQMLEMANSLKQIKLGLEQMTSEMDFSSSDSALVNGSEFKPRLSALLEYSNDGVLYAFHICAQVKSVLLYIQNVGTFDSESLLGCLSSLKIDEITKNKINKIIFITSFCRIL